MDLFKSRNFFHLLIVLGWGILLHAFVHKESKPKPKPNPETQKQLPHTLPVEIHKPKVSPVSVKVEPPEKYEQETYEDINQQSYQDPEVYEHDETEKAIQEAQQLKAKVNERIKHMEKKITWALEKAQTENPEIIPEEAMAALEKLKELEAHLEDHLDNSPDY